jgi:hypothetical protein
MAIYHPPGRCSLFAAMQTSGLPPAAERAGMAPIKTFKVFFESPLFQQFSCGMDEINGVCKNAKQC